MNKIEHIHVDFLHPHPDNPRKDLGDLTELAESIKANGVLQNLTVVPAEEGGYRIIIGHRRYVAAKLAGFTDLPCVIADISPQKQFQTMMIENVNRSDLTAYEQAEGFQMMLDMGDTVESVAKQTGFSETTIRRRVKLLDLDKGKFQQAEERGGTMQDYLKLQSIGDPALRDKVLDTVGTANFANSLKNAVDLEEKKRIMAELTATIKAADWCQEIDPATVQNHGAYRYVRNISRWNPDTTAPEDADTAKYVFCITAAGICLYRENPKNMASDHMAEKKELLEDELKEISKDLDAISRRHREMREEFIQNYKAFNSSEMDIASFAVKAMMYAVDNRITVDTDRLGNLLGVPVSAKGELDPTAWNKVLFNMPQHVLLCTAYAMLEGGGRKYNYAPYNSNARVSMPSPEKSLSLDLIYSGLRSLDYEMSDEEKQMKDGTHPLYRKAKFLVDTYLHEKEKANEQQEEKS